MNSEALRNAIENCLQTQTQDETEYIIQLNKIIKEAGPQVYIVIFHVLTHIDFPLEKAKMYWDQITDHHSHLKKLLKRNVGLRTAVCDYFSRFEDPSISSKLIDLHLLEKEMQFSQLDYMTGLFSRDYFDKTMETELKSAQRHNSNLSVAFLDLDGFKLINDACGHLTGDRILKQVAGIILSSQREEDISARYCDDKFVVIMPRTDSIQAIVLAERIREKVEAFNFSLDSRGLRLTITGGIATYPENGNEIKNLLRAANSALNSAKNSGKNEIAVFIRQHRKFLRIDFIKGINVTQTDTNYEIDTNLQCKNLSKMGVLFENDKPMEIGTLLKLNIPINEASDPLEVKGNIVRVESIENGKYDIGISFLNVEKTAKDEITQVIINHLTPSETANNKRSRCNYKG